MAEGDAAVRAFQRIISGLRATRRRSRFLPSLRKPAGANAIAEFEAKTTLKLPAGLAAIYRLHDGQDAGDPGRGEGMNLGLFPSLESDNLAFLLSPLKELRSSMRGSQMPGFRKGWVPFGYNYFGDNIVLNLDLAATEPRKRGRVLEFNHEYGGAVELAASFDAYLKHLADGLKSKKIRWDDEAGLSYARGREWEDLIEKKKVEYDPKYLDEFGGAGVGEEG